MVNGENSGVFAKAQLWISDNSDILIHAIFMTVIITGLTALGLYCFAVAGLELPAALELWGNLGYVIECILIGLGSLLYEIRKRNNARKALSTTLQQLEVALDASASVDPRFFRYPYPKWVDFAEHIYRRKEIDLLKEDLNHNLVSMIIGKPGSGKTVLIQLVGYELQDEFDYIFYEDFARPSDSLLAWHHQTEGGDEYRLTECLNKISNLSNKSGKNIKSLVILDNIHMYVNFFRHLQEIASKKLPNRICVLLAKRPKYRTIAEEIEYLQRSIPKEIISPMVVRGQKTNFETKMDGLLNDSNIELNDIEPYLGELQERGLPTDIRQRTIPCRFLSDKRTKDVVIEMLKWIGIRFGNQEIGEGWVRNRIGANILFLALFVKSMVPKGKLLELDENEFCRRINDKFKKVETNILNQPFADDFLSGTLKNEYGKLLKVLSWFAYFDAFLPEPYICQDENGILADIDRDAFVQVLNYLVKQNEVIKGRHAGNYIYSLPHKSMGLVILQCTKTIDFSKRPYIHPEADVLTGMALDILSYMNGDIRKFYMSTLISLASINGVLDPSNVCDFLKQNPAELARLVLENIVYPGFFEKCMFPSEIPGLVDNILRMLEDRDLDQCIEFLEANLSNPWMINVLLDDRIVTAIISRIHNDNRPIALFIKILRKRDLLWNHPPIKDAIVSKIRDMIISGDDELRMIVDVISDLATEESVVEAVCCSIEQIVEKMREETWATLDAFAKFDCVLENEKIKEIVTSTHEDIPESLNLDIIISISDCEGFLKDIDFEENVADYLESKSVLQKSRILLNEKLIHAPKIRRVIRNTANETDMPWQLIPRKEIYDHLQKSEWGKDTIDIVAEKLEKAIRNIKLPHLDIANFSTIKPFCSNESIVNAIRSLSAKMADYLLQGGENIARIISVLSGLYYLPSEFRTDQLEEAIESESENLTEMFALIPSSYTYSPFGILLAFPSLLDNDIWIEQFKRRLREMGPHVEDLFVIANIAELKENPEIQAIIEDRLDALVASFYEITANRYKIAYVCKELPFLTESEVIQETLRNLGLAVN